MALGLSGTAGLAVWVAMAGVPGGIPLGLAVGWVVLVAGEWWAGSPPDELPELERGEGTLALEVPLQDRIGGMSLLLPAGIALIGPFHYVPLALEALSLTLPGWLQFALTVAVVPVALIAVLMTLYFVSARVVRVELEAERRILTFREPLRRAQQLYFGEVVGIRVIDGELRIEHAQGHYGVALPQVETERLRELAEELDAFAHARGADVEAKELHERAEAALSKARPVDQ